MSFYIFFICLLDLSCGDCIVISCILCIYLSIDLFILCNVCMTVSVNCLLKQFSIFWVWFLFCC